MKICFVSFEFPPRIIGGAGSYAGFLVKGLRERGIEVCLITRGHKNACDRETYEISTPELGGWQRLFFMKGALSLLNHLNKRSKFDLVHFNEPHIITTNPRLPTVSTFHSCQVLKLKGLETSHDIGSVIDLVSKGVVGGLSEIYSAHVSDRIICPSRELERVLNSYYFVDREKIHVIPNGIDLATFDEVDTDSVVSNVYDIEKGNFILYIGRLSPMKGVQYLIKAFQEIKKDHTRLKLIIAGSGEFETCLKNFASGMRDVIFVGWINSLSVKKWLYENCVSIVLPSLNEALPMVLMEAMAFSKPIVASSVGDIPTLVRHGKNGFLVKPTDVKSLKKFIRILYENPKIGRRMGLFGRKRLEEEFTIDSMVNKTLKIYNLLN